MHLSDLQNKDIVNIKDGKKIGNIVDVTIDNNGYMISFIIQKSKFNINIFKGNNEEEIKWNQIKKIGEDVILVDTNN
ncbi:MAG: YlmC/YmxH family sporulation protein [Bacilli bacterium]|nr:YlmC/YmxH family sporulation protein [Bacilli bacterium]